MSETTILSPQALLIHWQGHRALTRRVIEAFPEDKLFSFSIGGMRPFGAMVIEFLSMAVPIAEGVATKVWAAWEEKDQLPKTKAALLAQWDKDTADLNRIFPTIPVGRFSEVDRAFGQWEGSGLNTILYAIDNEIHHRGQSFVYLRSLGITPPNFYER
jgi:uncharacterized damage-inducible protein DinB